MTQYIDKSALLAEIDRLDALYHTSKNLSGELFIKELSSFINALEVKEVDLEKEIEEHAIHMPLSEFTHDREVEDFHEWAKEEFRHFFELGLKAQKGE